MVDLVKKKRRGGGARERDLDRALEAIHIAFRAVVKRPDELLARLRLTRVHHRVLYVIRRRPKSSILEILMALQVSKQYLHQPLAQLIRRGYVKVVQDSEDRRIKRLLLSSKGEKLERQLSGMQRKRFARVFAESGPVAERTWHRVMALLGETRFD